MGLEPLRVGFVGAGAMATWQVYPSLHFAPIHLQAVCDRDEDLARDTAGKFGPGRWYTDYRKMWETEDLEAVIVQMHPRPRQRIVLEALEAGYHVFIPKPPAASLDATQELGEAASRAGRILMVNFQRRFCFGVTKAREIMAAESFGAMTQFFGSFCSGIFDEARGRDYDDSVHAYILDFAPHYLDIARFLGGEIQQLSLFHQQDGSGVALAVALEFVSGAVGTLQLNSQRLWWRNYDRIEITGKSEYLVLDDLWSIKHYAQERNTFTENWSDERSGELTGDGPCLVEWVRAIREGREPIGSIADAVETMRLYQAIWDAVQEGRSGVVFDRRADASC